VRRHVAAGADQDPHHRGEVVERGVELGGAELEVFARRAVKERLVRGAAASRAAATTTTTPIRT